MHVSDGFIFLARSKATAAQLDKLFDWVMVLDNDKDDDGYNRHSYTLNDFRKYLNTED